MSKDFITEVEGLLNQEYYLDDGLEEIRSILSNVNYARVFLVLYNNHKKGFIMPITDIGRPVNLESSNCYKYVHYFEKVGLIKIVRSRTKKRGAVITQKNEKLETLIPTAITTVKHHKIRSIGIVHLPKQQKTLPTK